MSTIETALLSDIRINQASCLNCCLEGRRLCSTDFLHFHFGGIMFKTWPGYQLS
jgi:hypothetical protein